MTREATEIQEIENARRRGSSALEVLVATAVATVIAFAVGSALRDSSLAVAEVNASVVSDSSSRAALLRVLDELRFASRTDLSPLYPDKSTSLQYRQIAGWENQQPVYTAWSEFRKVGDGLYLDNDQILSNVVTFEVSRTDDILHVVLVVSRTVETSGQAHELERTLHGRVVLSN